MVGGRNKKGHVYGLGALGDEYVSSATPSSQSVHGPTPDVRGLVANLNSGLVSQLAERVAALKRENHLLYQHLGVRPSGSGSIPEDAAASGTCADGPNVPNALSVLPTSGQQHDADDHKANDDWSPTPPIPPPAPPPPLS